MALQTSGPISLSEIQAEVGYGSAGLMVSLAEQSNDAGFTAPHSMSEFYGYADVILSTWTITRFSNSFNISADTSGNWSGTADGGTDLTFNLTIDVTREAYFWNGYYMQYTTYGETLQYNPLHVFTSIQGGVQNIYGWTVPGNNIISFNTILSWSTSGGSGEIDVLNVFKSGS